MRNTVKGGDALKKLRKSLRKTLKADDSQHDLEFLYKFLSDGQLKAAVSLFDTLENGERASENSPSDSDNLIDAVQSTLDDLYSAADYNDEAMQLCELLSKPHMRAFFDAHDDVAKKRFLPEVLPLPTGALMAPQTAISMSSGLHSPAIDHNTNTPVVTANSELARSHEVLTTPGSTRPYGGNPSELIANIGPVPPDSDPFDPTTENMVGIPKVKGEDLGITIGVKEIYHDGHDDFSLAVIVERVMAGSSIEQRGLLFPGDIIREVNGLPVDSPETLQKFIREAPPGTITLKIIPAEREKQHVSSLYVRAHVSYTPDYDSLLPCREAGLRFLAGDVLQIVNQEDPHWWQARKFGEDSRAGLIPSTTLQERRKAFDQSARDLDVVNYKVFGCGLRKKKKMKMVFKASVAEEFEKNDLVIYEEVALIPAFQRKVICLLGANGVGRSTIKDRLIRSNPERYSKVIPHTSRPMKYGDRDGVQYYFVGREAMEVDILSQQYLEYGEFEGYLYGTKVDTVRSVTNNTGKTIILDCSPSALKMLRTPEFMPYVVFIAAPSVECMKAMYEFGITMGLSDKPKRDEDFRKTVEASIDIERNFRHFFDFVLINDNMDLAYEVLENHLDDLLKTQQWVPVNWIY